MEVRKNIDRSPLSSEQLSFERWYKWIKNTLCAWVFALISVHSPQMTFAQDTSSDFKQQFDCNEQLDLGEDVDYPKPSSFNKKTFEEQFDDALVSLEHYCFTPWEIDTVKQYGYQQDVFPRLEKLSEYIWKESWFEILWGDGDIMIFILLDKEVSGVASSRDPKEKDILSIKIPNRDSQKIENLLSEISATYSGYPNISDVLRKFYKLEKKDEK